MFSFIDFYTYIFVIFLVYIENGRWWTKRLQIKMILRNLVLTIIAYTELLL